VRGGPARAKKERVSLRALSRTLGVSLAAVQKAIRAGRLRESVGRDGRGSFITSSALAQREWAAGAAKPHNNGKSGDGTLVEAQRRVALERAAALELGNRRKRGELLDADTVLREQFEAARVLRDAILNIPERLSAELASENSPQRVHAQLSRELRRALDSVAELLERG
jgi:phage terminase Nu1 subunit (DNA packaging protein)